MSAQQSSSAAGTVSSRGPWAVALALLLAQGGVAGMLLRAPGHGAAAPVAVGSDRAQKQAAPTAPLAVPTSAPSAAAVVGRQPASAPSAVIAVAAAKPSVDPATSGASAGSTATSGGALPVVGKAVDDKAADRASDPASGGARDGGHGRPVPRRGRRAKRHRIARLKITSTPRAAVVVDGLPRGRTPLTLALEAGVRRIELSAPNHKSYAKSVSLRATERRTLDVALGAVASTPAPAVPATVAAAVPARSVAVVPPPRRVAVTAAPRGDAPKGAGAEPKVTAPRPIPTLKLPVSVRVNLYTEDGKRARFAGMVLFAVENVVTRSLGLSAAGSTGPLLRYLYSQPKDEDAKVKLYPRTMGYFVAHALSREEKGVGARLLQAYRSGRIEKLAQRSWRP